MLRDRVVLEGVVSMVSRAQLIQLHLYHKYQRTLASSTNEAQHQEKLVDPSHLAMPGLSTSFAQARTRAKRLVLQRTLLLSGTLWTVKI